MAYSFQGNARLPVNHRSGVAFVLGVFCQKKLFNGVIPLETAAEAVRIRLARIGGPRT
jgi:hypothetical protein